MFLDHRAALRTDFAAVQQLLTERRRLPKLDVTSEASAKRAHHLSYSLMLWSYRLDGVLPRAYEFTVELASEAMQFLPHCLDGYTRTPLLLARCVIENALRHIYFLDHPVELARFMANEYSVSPSELLTYIGEHPDFRDAQTQFDGRADLSSSYGELSEHIHGARALHEDIRLSPEEIVFDPAIFRQQVEIFSRATRACNFALAMIHCVRMRAWVARDRAIVLRTIPRAARLAISATPKRPTL